MKMRLYMNELGLHRTEDGRWGVRQINEHSWAIQNRNDPKDPWGWEILSYRPTFDLAVKRMNELIKVLH